MDGLLESRGARDTAVIVNEGVDVNEYETITGNRYTYVHELIKSWR